MRPFARASKKGVGSVKSIDSRIEFGEIIECVDMFPGTCITPLATRIKIRLGRYMMKAQTMIVAADSGGQLC
jgi:hypothetical protein